MAATIELKTSAHLAKVLLGTGDVEAINSAAQRLGLKPYQVVNGIHHWDKEAAAQLGRYFGSARVVTRGRK